MACGLGSLCGERAALIAIGGRMATEDLIQTRLNGDSFDNSSLDPPGEFWAPPLASTETLDTGDMPLRQEILGPATRDEHSFQPLEENDFAETETSFGSRRKLIELIVGTTIVAALGIVTLAYLWAPAGEKPAAHSANPLQPCNPHPRFWLRRLPGCPSPLVTHLLRSLGPTFRLPSLPRLLPRLRLTHLLQMPRRTKLSPHRRIGISFFCNVPA